MGLDLPRKIQHLKHWLEQHFVHKRVTAIKVCNVCWSPMASWSLPIPDTAWWTAPIPFIQWGWGWPGTIWHTCLSNKNKFTAYPRQRKAFPNKKEDYRSKQQLHHPCFCMGECFRPRTLIMQSQRGVAAHVMAVSPAQIIYSNKNIKLPLLWWMQTAVINLLSGSWMITLRMVPYCVLSVFCCWQIGHSGGHSHSRSQGGCFPQQMLRLFSQQLIKQIDKISKDIENLKNTINHFKV